MKKLTARIRAIISSPKKDLRKVEKQLLDIKEEMLGIQTMINKIQAMAELFTIISPLQDKRGFSETILKLRKKNYGQLNLVISAFENLQRHIQLAGRDSCGINRTEIGEPISLQKIFLGNVYGIWTKPASYWLQNQEKFKNEDSGLLPKSGCGGEFVSIWYCINDCQAGDFVKIHTSGIIKNIKIIKDF